MPILFSDLKAERSALQKHVFPELYGRCKRYGWTFQPLDLRWGVSEEASLDQQTMNICLREIRRCQEISPKLNFVVLLGNRYGWQPLPPQIHAEEFETLSGHLTREERVHLGRWYRRDDNAVPAEYVLLPRKAESAYADVETWAKEESTLLTMLRRAVAGLYPQQEDPRRKRYFQSAVHQEIEAGVLSVEGAESHVLCWFREFDQGAEDSQSDLKDWDRQAKLKGALRVRLPSHSIHECRVPWSYEPEENDSALCQMCEFFLRAALDNHGSRDPSHRIHRRS